MAIAEKVLGRDHLDVAQGWNNLAMIYGDHDRIDAAFAASTRAVEILRRRLSIGATQRSVGALAEQRTRRFFFTMHILIAYAAAGNSPDRRRETAAQMFEWAQMAQPSTAIAAMAARFAAGSDSRAATIRQRQDLVQQWQQLGRRLDKAAALPQAERRPGEEQSLRSTLEETARHLDALDQRMAIELPEFAELTSPKPLALAAAQALL